MKSISCTAQLRLHFQKKENVRLDFGENSRNVRLNSSQSRPVTGSNQAGKTFGCYCEPPFFLLKRNVISPVDYSIWT